MPRVATQNTAHDPVFGLVIGATGCGKTTMVKAQLSAIAQAFGRIVIADPRGQFGAKARIPELAFWLARTKPGTPAIIAVQAFSESDRRYIGELLWHFGDALAVVDEFQLYGDASAFSERVWHLITTEGRAYGLGILGITQRIAMVPKHYLADVTDIVAFTTHTELELRWLRTYIGREAADQLPHLGQHQAHVWGKHRHLFLPQGAGKEPE